MTSRNGQRLHPVALVMYLFPMLKMWIIPMGISIFIPLLGRETLDGSFFLKTLSLIATVGGIILLMGVYGGLQWWLYRYEIIDGQLIVCQGVLIRQKTNIPVARIQSVDSTENVVHRLTQTVKLQIQTSGGFGKPEAILLAVSLQESIRLREILLPATTQTHRVSPQHVSIAERTPREPAPPQTPFTFPVRRLLLSSCDIRGIGIGVAVLIGLFEQVDQLVVGNSVWVWLWELFSVEIMVLFFGGLFLGGWLLSVGVAAFRFAYFTITPQHDALYISRGLIERKHVTLKYERIQAIKMIEQPLLQWLGYRTLYVVSTGYGGQPGELFVLHPLIKETEMNDFLRSCVPSFSSLVDTTIMPLPQRSRSTYWIVPVAVIGLCTAVFVPFTIWGWLGVPLLVCTIVYALLCHRSGGWGTSDTLLLLRRRRWNRTTLFVPRTRIQTMHVQQSPWARRKRIARYTVSIASSGMFKRAFGLHFSLRGCDVDVCHRLIAWWRKSYETPIENSDTEPIDR